MTEIYLRNIKTSIVTATSCRERMEGFIPVKYEYIQTHSLRCATHSPQRFIMVFTDIVIMILYFKEIYILFRARTLK
jgi:hypothetical protein